MIYKIGDVARISALFTSITNVPTDPTVVTLLVQAPNNTQTLYNDVSNPAVVRDSTGNYHLDLPLTQAGANSTDPAYLYRWTATGTVGVVIEGTLIVSPTILKVPPTNWTYSGNPANSVLDEIRFLIGDTDSSKGYRLLDGEIQYAITLYSSNPPVIGNNFFAAAVCAEAILARFKSFFGNKSVGDLSVGANQQTLTFFQENAYRLRQRANIYGVVPSFGGESYAEKRAAADNNDVPQTAAIIDGMSIFGPNSGNTPSGGGSPQDV